MAFVAKDSQNHGKSLAGLGSRLPTKSASAPSGPDCLHEVKIDGYRRLERDGDSVRLITRGGYDWRGATLVDAARKVRQKRFVLDASAMTGPVLQRAEAGRPKNYPSILK